MTALQELIERIEKANEPTRELFKAAYVAVYGAVNYNTDSDAAVDRHSAFIGFVRAGAWLDAAMSLGDKPGWRILIDKRPGAEHRADGWRAQVYREGHPYKSDMSDMPTAWARTAALALVAACLKAINMKEGK